MFKKLKIVPIPKVFKLGNLHIELPEILNISFVSDNLKNEDRILKVLRKISPSVQIVQEDAFIKFIKTKLDEEEYELKLMKKGLQLRELLKRNGSTHCKV